MASFPRRVSHGCRTHTSRTATSTRLLSRRNLQQQQQHHLLNCVYTLTHSSLRYDALVLPLVHLLWRRDGSSAAEKLGASPAQIVPSNPNPFQIQSKSHGVPLPLIQTISIEVASTSRPNRVQLQSKSKSQPNSIQIPGCPNESDMALSAYPPRPIPPHSNHITIT